MNTLSLILGSGFSYNAGLPLAKDINSYFTRDNKRQLLHFSSDEWKWYDLASDVDKNNGSFSYNRIAYGYILNEMVSYFINNRNSFDSYEEFYQFVIDGLNKQDFLRKISLKAHEKFDANEEVKKDNQFYDIYTRVFLHPEKRQIYNMVNYLIGELLYWRKPFEEFRSKYNPFLTYLSSFEQKEIFTLNHDLLLETLFYEEGIRYCDGFSVENSRLQSESGKKISCFNGSFDSNINLLKLHGSIDLYQYICAEQKGSILNPTGEFIYYKTHDYYEKQKPIRIDLETGETVQNFHWNITPQFVTGTKKGELIEMDKMYKALYSELNERITNTNTLLIVGYSYMDEHINKQIKRVLKQEKLDKIINVNPGMEFPYNDCQKEIVNLKDINELK